MVAGAVLAFSGYRHSAFLRCGSSVRCSALPLSFKSPISKLVDQRSHHNLPSLKDVARLAGVSIGTVSRYLNDPEQVRPTTRSVIRDAVATLHYSPNTIARSLRRGRTNLVMVLVWAVGDPFYGDLIQGIGRAARRRDFSVYIKEANSIHMTPADLNDIVLSRQADGVILLGGPSPYEQDGDYRNSPLHPPVVVAGEVAVPSMRELPGVRIDNYKAAADMTRYVIGLGHKRIAFIGGEVDSLLLADRETAFRDVMAAADLAVPDEYVAYGNLVIEGARRATRELLNLAVPPTAIICGNDEMAIGTMAEARSMGLDIPGDLSVVGFDDIRYADVMNPPLTTVGHPAVLVGEQSFHLLWRLLQDPTADVQAPAIPHRLVIRGSAAPPKG
jgi:LacI family repressor for deo operon, udp, cdd, tsx, nupC, and nupG